MLDVWISKCFYAMASFLSKLALTTACALLLTFSASHAQTATPAEIAAEAEALARQGNMPAALERMQQAADALWDLQNFQLLRSGFEGDGSLQDSLVLKSGEAFTAVAGLTGFGYQKNATNLGVSFEVDLEIQHQSGRVLARKQNFAIVSETVSKRLAEFTLKMKVQTPALLDGAYKAVFTVRDVASSQSQEFTLAFTINGILE